MLEGRLADNVGSEWFIDIVLLVTLLKSCN